MLFRRTSSLGQVRWSHTYEEMLHARQTSVCPSIKPHFRKPVYLKKGHMQYLWDHQDKKYLDFIGGIVTVSVGHCHPRINEAMKQQMEKLWHTTTVFITDANVEYSQKLLAKFPKHLNTCFLLNSGTEANDLAVLLSRIHTGNFDMLAMRNAYHGNGYGVMGATNLRTWKQPTPSGFGFHAIRNADPYRGPFGGQNCRNSRSQVMGRSCACGEGKCEASEKYVDEVNDVLIHTVPKPAGMFLESIQGAGGCMQFPKGFVKGAFDAVKTAGGVCISDEVQTGFGRLGDSFWGFQQHGEDVKPDIVTMAKGIGNGFPMAALVTTSEIAATLGTALYFNTFGGNPLAATVGSTVLDIIEEEGLQENSRFIGDYLMHVLLQLKTSHPMIGDVRGKGLYMGIEFVNPKSDNRIEPLNGEKMGDIFENLRDNGVLVRGGGVHGNVIRIAPPMCINKDNCDEFVSKLEQAINAIKL